MEEQYYPVWALKTTMACGAALPKGPRELDGRVRPDLIVGLSSWEVTDRVFNGQWAPYSTTESDNSAP